MFYISTFFKLFLIYGSGLRFLRFLRLSRKFWRYDFFSRDFHQRTTFFDFVNLIFFSKKKQQHTNLGGLFREIFIWKFPAEISLIRFPDKIRIDFINLFYFLVQRCDWFCDITELWFEILDNFRLVVDF